MLTHRFPLQCGNPTRGAHGADEVGSAALALQQKEESRFRAHAEHYCHPSAFWSSEGDGLERRTIVCRLMSTPKQGVPCTEASKKKETHEVFKVSPCLDLLVFVVTQPFFFE